MEQATGGSVQGGRDWWLLRRDEWRGVGSDGGDSQTSGQRVSIRAIYIGIAVIVATSCAINAFSVAYDLTRLGRPHSLWEPVVWEATSAILIIALLALPRRANKLVSRVASRPLRTVIVLCSLAVAFSALHICGMVSLRQLAYLAAGKLYSFNWSVGEVLYELRKDLFSFSTLAVTFWLAERALVTSSQAIALADNRECKPALPTEATSSHDLWLRDGTSSILVQAADILWVSSAGNYVEYVLAAGQRHLIRTTLQAEEARLSRFGIVRVHRTRLVNTKRIVAINWRSSGDFELRLDDGETISGSRRYKGAIKCIGA